MTDRHFRLGKRRLLVIPFLLLLLSSLLSSSHAEPIDQVRFDDAKSGSNFTLCSSSATSGNFSVYSVDRFYDPETNRYNFSASGESAITVTDLNAEGNYFSSARIEVLFGFSIAVNVLERLCSENISGGCPVHEGSIVTIQKSVVMPGMSMPLGDIITRYSTTTANGDRWACFTLAPVGYQNPTWQMIFLYVPAAFTLFAASVSCFASFATVSDDISHDGFLFTSNYAMLPAALRLRTPGFFDVIYYAQFIVVTGQLSLAYPKFYPLFTSNFAWSFLLFNTDWFQDMIARTFNTPSETPSLVKGTISPYALNGTASDPGVNVTGTGMDLFSSALEIDVRALFLTGLIFFLIILAACLAACFLFWVAAAILRQWNPEKFSPQRYNNRKILDFSIGIIIRAVTLFYLPLMILSFYQLMLAAQWYLLLPAAIILVFHIFMVYGYIAFVLLDVRPPSLIFSDITLLLRYGCLYNTFTDDKFYFFLISLLYRVVVGLMVAGFQTNGTAQLIVIILAEFTFLLLHFVLWPYASRPVNVQYIVLGVFRLVIVLLNIAYLDHLHILNRDKQAVAYVQVVLHCVVFLMLFFALPVRNLVVLLTGLADDELYEMGVPPARMALWRRRKRGQAAGPQHVRVSTRETPPPPPPHSWTPEQDPLWQQQQQQQRQRQQQQRVRSYSDHQLLLRFQEGPSVTDPLLMMNEHPSRPKSWDPFESKWRSRPRPQWR